LAQVCRCDPATTLIKLPFDPTTLRIRLIPDHVEVGGFRRK